MTQNSFGFILIIFTPVAISYCKTKYGNRLAILLAIAVVLAGGFSGSRAAGLLVLLGSVLGYYSSRTKVSGVAIVGIIFIPLLVVLVNTQFFADIIQTINPRIFDLVYNLDTTLATDRSYLTRVLMVEKGLIIYEEFPLYGVGLNNFLTYPVELRGDFAGAEWVINKGLEEGTSSHNSYINILGEGGLFLFLPFAFLMILNLLMGLMNYKKFDPFSRAMFFGFGLMLVHFYFITSVVNFYCWLFISVVSSINFFYLNYASGRTLSRSY